MYYDHFETFWICCISIPFNLGPTVYLGTIGFCLLLRESGNNQDFIEKVLNLDNKDKTKWLLLKWPLVLYRMKKSKRP